MRNSRRLLVSAMACFGVFFAVSSQAFAWEDQIACYKTERFPRFRIKLDVKEHSRLSEPAEESAFHNAKQKAFSVHGKAINGCYFGSMAPATGTIVVAERVNSMTNGATGAHLSLTDNLVRDNFCAPVSLDCTTNEVSHVPHHWICYARNQFGAVFEFEMHRTRESRDPLCSIFEDTRPVAAETETEEAINRRVEEAPAN